MNSLPNQKVTEFWARIIFLNFHNVSKDAIINDQCKIHAIAPGWVFYLITIEPIRCIKFRASDFRTSNPYWVVSPNGYLSRAVKLVSLNKELDAKKITALGHVFKITNRRQVTRPYDILHVRWMQRSRWHSALAEMSWSLDYSACPMVCRRLLLSASLLRASGTL